MSPQRELAGERFASALHVVFMSPQRELGGAQSLAPHPADAMGSSNTIWGLPKPISLAVLSMV